MPNNKVFLQILPSHLYKLNWVRRPSALTYNVFIKSLLWSYKLYTVLRRRWYLHPIILTFGNRYTILCALKNRGHLKCYGIILSNLKCKNKVSNNRRYFSSEWSFRTFQITSTILVNLPATPTQQLQYWNDLSTHLHKLILETFETVETHSSHITILQCDCSFSWFMLADEGKILQENSNEK